MTLANSVVAKLSVAFVALATAFVLAAPAQAQMSESEMQSEIDRLTALIEQLTASLGGGSMGGDSMSSSVCPYTWTRDLSQGSTGMDVMKLQQFLNSSDDTRVAAAGAVGSAGMETEYYGPATAAAVSKMQTKYRSEVLAPAGLVNPTGYFGPSSRAKANMLCTSAPSMDDDMMDDDMMDDDMMDDDDMNDDDNRDLEGGAGSLDDVDKIAGISNEDVGEGQDDVPVIGLEIEADQASDIMITALDLDFDQSTGATEDLNDYITDVSVWFDGDMIASFDVDEFDRDDDWDSTVSLGSNGPIIRAGDTGDLVVAVSGINNLDSSDNGDIWNITIAEVRFRDGDDAVITDDNTGDLPAVEPFTIEDFASAADIELKVTEEDDTINDARTIPVDDDDDTDNVEILSFSIEAEGDSDLEVEELSVDFTSVGAGVGEIINSAAVWVDGEELDSENVSSTTATTRTITFLDVDLLIPAGDTVEVIISVDVNDIDGAFTNGDTLSADVNPDDAGWDVRDEQDDVVGAADKTGAATSDAHDFIASGLIIDFVSRSASPQLNLDTTSTDDQGYYEVVFTVEAFDDTAWIELTAASSTDANADDVGAAISIEDTSNNTVTGGTTTSPTLERVSGGSVEGNFVRLNDGQKATFKVSAYYDAATTGSYRMQLNQIGFNQTSAASADQAQAVTPVEDYESSSQQVLN